jgi:ribosome biogenesis GTPase A
MQNGKINYKKSDLQNARCPRYAVEGVTKDKQDVRIVYAQCNESTTVVTVIDLDTEWTCDCPGDDKD